jgi:hypothetical protein
MPIATRIREWAGRLGLVVGSLLGLLLLLEIALQLGSLALRATGRELPAGWLTGGHRILCLGDSNTYGLYLEPEERIRSSSRRSGTGPGNRGSRS